MSSKQFQHPVVIALRQIALAFPEVEEGDSCVKHAFRVRKKGFLYLGEKEHAYNVMVKLAGSLDEAKVWVQAEPGRYAVGSAGWVTIKLPADEMPPDGLIERWIDESFRLQAPKAVLEQLG